MACKRRVDPQPSGGWLELKRLHPDHSILESESIYALPLRLIQVLSTGDDALFTPDEKRFEEDLRRLGGFGFFQKHPFQFPLLAADLRAENGTVELDEPSQKIRELLADEMKSHGKSDSDIKHHIEERHRLQVRIEERRTGYGGWLATHPEFHLWRDAFRCDWQARIINSGQFPQFPLSYFGETPDKIPKRDREFYDDYMCFYRKWSIESLATWELPVPMRAELTLPCLYDYYSIGEAGFTMFIPWYLFVDKNLKLEDVAYHHRAFGHADHLIDWFKGGSKKLGHSRFAVMLRLFVYLEIALKGRYQSKLRKRTAYLDKSFAKYDKDDNADQLDIAIWTETIRKIRIQMNRRLRECRRVVADAN